MFLLLDEHQTEVEARVAMASSLVFFLDFDGTLASIVSQPGLAHFTLETRRVLEELPHQDGVLVAY